MQDVAHPETTAYPLASCPGPQKRWPLTRNSIRIAAGQDVAVALIAVRYETVALFEGDPMDMLHCP